MRRIALSLPLVLLALAASAGATDWLQFRGPNAAGIAAAGQTVPTAWGEKQNLKWRQELPGAGSSSPIVVGEKVFLTCFSGHRSGVENLKRHLVCLDRKTGKILWDQKVAGESPEDPYRGFITEHGYATSTPVSDGENVYVFFGKSGVLAFDMTGKQLWQENVGKESGRMRWGSGTSPILYKNLVIVNASDESQSIRALHKKDGKQAWKAEAGGLASSWSTPVLVTARSGRTELVVNVPYEVWALDPDTGKLLWYAETQVDTAACPTLVVNEDIVYAIGGRRGGSAAIRAGGKDDVTKTHVLWNGRQGSYVPSPVYLKGKLYWVNDRGIAICVNAADGTVVKQERLGGGGRSRAYSSITLIGDKLYWVGGDGTTTIMSADAELKKLGTNKLSDGTSFNASPAVVDGQIFLRSDKYLYCIARQEKAPATKSDAK